MRYANAGHPKPLHVRRREGNVSPVNAPCKVQPALGLFEGAEYQTSELKLLPGDLIMLFTDGLYEVQGPNDEIYTQDLLIAGVKRRVQQPAGQLFDELLQEIDQFAAGSGFSDDVCLVGVEAAAPAAA